MSDITFTEKSGSLWFGNKRRAKYTGAYIDLDNVYNKDKYDKPRLTSGNYYKIIQAGEAHNPHKPFKNYYEMIIIRDDSDKAVGIPAECFDFDDAYIDDYALGEKLKGESSSEEAEEIEEEEDDAEDLDFDDDQDEEDDDQDDDDTPVVTSSMLKNILRANENKYSDFDRVDHIKTDDEITSLFKNHKEGKLIFYHQESETFTEYFFNTDTKRVSAYCYQIKLMALNTPAHSDFLKKRRVGWFFHN